MAAVTYAVSPARSTRGPRRLRSTIITQRGPSRRADDHGAGSAAEPLGGLLFDIRVAVARRDDLHRQVGRAVIELLRFHHALGTYKGDVRATNGIGISFDQEPNVVDVHLSEAVLSDVVDQARGDESGQRAVLETRR